MEKAGRATRDAFIATRNVFFVMVGVGLVMFFVILLAPGNRHLWLHWDWSNRELPQLMTGESVILAGAILFGLCAYGHSVSRRWVIMRSLILSAGMVGIVVLEPSMKTSVFPIFLAMLLTLPLAIFPVIAHLSGLAMRRRHAA